MLTRSCERLKDGDLLMNEGESDDGGGMKRRWAKRCRND